VPAVGEWVPGQAMRTLGATFLVTLAALVGVCAYLGRRRPGHRADAATAVPLGAHADEAATHTERDIPPGVQRKADPPTPLRTDPRGVPPPGVATHFTPPRGAQSSNSHLR
jgi:hypothetical protein